MRKINNEALRAPVLPAGKTAGAATRTTLRLLAFAVLAAAVPAFSQQALPSDLLIDPAGKNRTLFPFATPNSGVVKYSEHRRDLTPWPSLSYEDKRPTLMPQRVILHEPLAGNAERGKQVAMNTQLGNCWACHALPGDAQPGAGGPPLLAFKTRGYSDAHVYQQIYDARVANPNTLMPPYGTFGTLTEQNLRDLTAYLQSIE